MFQKKLTLLAAIFLTSAISLYSQAFAPRPIVRNIQAKQIDSNKIRISWKLPSVFTADALFIYKDTQPFTSNSQLTDDKKLATVKPNAVAFTDIVKTYQDFYYCVVAVNSDGIYSIVLPSINATAQGVSVSKPAKKENTKQEAEPVKSYPAGSMRELPLPYLDVIQDFDREPTVFGKEAQAAGIELADGHTRPELVRMTPYIFEQDLAAPAGGDDYLLFEILKNHFVKKGYSDAVDALKEFLAVNRSEEVTNRAVFYLAQSQYFCNRYRAALLLFLFVEDSYPAETKKWIDSALDYYELPN